MVFFLMLSLFYVLKYEETKRNRFIFLSVVSSALSISIHYIGISSIIFPIFAIIKNRKNLTSRLMVAYLVIFSAITSLFYLLNYNGVIRIVVDMKKYYDSTGYTSILPIGTWERFYYIFRDYFLLDPVYLALFGVMLIIFMKRYLRSNYSKYILIGLLFNYLLMISVVAAPKMSRWLLIFITLSVPFGAGSLIDFLKEKKINISITAAISGLFLLPSFIITLHWLNLLDHNTYMETRDWLENEVKHGAIVYTFDPLVYATPSYETALHEKEKNNNLVSKKFEYMIQNKQSFEGKGVILLSDKRNQRYKELGGTDTRYVIVNDDKTAMEIRKYHKLELILSFEPTRNRKLIEHPMDGEALNSPQDSIALLELDKSGPFLYVYEVVDLP
jgi:hypothetical protein